MEAIFTSSAPAEIPITSASVHQRGKIIIDLIKSDFGKGEFAVRCLSLNASSSGRCKGFAKCGSLFCTSHSKMGVVASPELLSAYNINKEAVRPFVAPDKVPGGVFETKASLDLNKRQQMAPKSPKKIAVNKCKKATGEICTTPTRFLDGYCHHHRGQVPGAAVAAAAAPPEDQEEEQQDEMLEEEQPIIAPVATRTRNKRRGTNPRK
jgi:hypothetical protein